MINRPSEIKKRDSGSWLFTIGYTYNDTKRYITIKVYPANITPHDKTGFMDIYRPVYFLEPTITRW